MKLLSKNWIKTVSVITTIPFLSSCFDLQINSNGYDYPVGTLDLNKQSLISNNISVPIPYQQSNGQNYLRNHGLSFVVSKNNDQKGTYFNGFILNILQNSGNDFDIPDVRLKQDSTPPTAKNKHDYQRPVTFLVATSFSNIKDLFNITKLEDVNENSSPTLFTGRTIKLGVMKFPDLISSSGKRDDYKLYQLDQDKKLEYDHNQLPNNFFLDVDPATVKLVYTATNLSINQDLFAFDQNLTKINDPSIRKKIENKLTNVVWVQSYDPTSEQPLQTTLPSAPLVQNLTPDYNYKFAVDFAVFQLTIAKDAINPFLRDLIDNIENSTTDYSITKISQQFALNNSLKTNDFVIGGYHKLSAEEAAREIIENAEPIFRAKKKTIASQVAAEKNFLASEVDKTK